MSKLKSNLLTILIPAAVIVLCLFILIYPPEMLAAAKNGVNLWFNMVLPSLLPFAVAVQLLIGLGVVNFFGEVFEPVSSRLFRLPGEAGFAIIMGLMSGYPIGSKLVAALRRQNAVSEREAEVLLAVANNSGPLFILGTVGVAMFKSPVFGYFLMAAHYSAAIINGLIFSRLLEKPKHRPKTRSPFVRAIRSMKTQRAKDGRPLGRLLMDAVKDSMETMFAIGGYIIFFSLVIETLKITGVMGQKALESGLIGGIVEITSGLRLLSSDGINLTTGICAVALVSFGGFSINAQCLGMLSGSGVRFMTYAAAKLTHTVIACIAAFTLFPFFKPFLDVSVPAFAMTEGFAANLSRGFTQLGGCLFIMILICIYAAFVRRRTRRGT